MDRDPSLRFESLAEQFAQQLRAGSVPDLEQYARENPGLADRIRSLFPVLQMMEQQQLSEIVDESDRWEEELQQLNENDSSAGSEFSQRERSADQLADSAAHTEVESHDLPPQIGRYRIDKVLGRGSFGVVYLAYDLQLNRQVAVKVPHSALIAKPEDAEAYLAEARTVANLDHPGIVPVYDIGSTEDYPCYIVAKYIAGLDLATKLKQVKQRRLKYRQASELIATVAEAMHYAHQQGIVHRDLKPSNILLGKDGQPYVVDFGLALREENIGQGPRYAGTPVYMSPEQARGEGHRVDGRSDIFSLGVVFYELLTGRRPFRGDTRAELFKRVTRYEARPLRQYDDKIPKELERICHKAMANRATERYFIAKDFAEDLRLFLQAESHTASSNSTEGKRVAGAGGSVEGGESDDNSVTQHTASSTLQGSSGVSPIRVIPKGLRSFDAHDADFFLELLPGPRDRAGLPDSLRFWKIRIEERDADQTFSVGLIYGPSGCGKSSLMKAGLIPRLSETVIPIYLEATGAELETRLLSSLRKHCAAIADPVKFDDSPSLHEMLSLLRRGQGIPAGRKILIVLDQFEQWLHVQSEERNSGLIQALRQCDGGRVQCIVMVRDDFWLAVSRFLGDLEVRLVEGQNSALVDLFDRDHARKVLAAFGRAFSRLPENNRELTIEHKAFLHQAVNELAEEGKVICVRLALFAEMMKGKPWTPASLKEVGGTSGVGVRFLEETFSSSTSPPAHRFHQQAARAVLKELLPSSGTDIKGSLRSHAELLEASGYHNRERDFADLIRILDSEVRLITPTDWEGNEKVKENSQLEDSPLEGRQDFDSLQTSDFKLRNSFFQLTHDYLVPSLRDWLTRKQKETRRGRAELKLSDTALTWNSKPENRFLPNWWDHLTIRWLTDKRKWTESQRKMMSQAGRVHGRRSSAVLLVLFSLFIAAVILRQQISQQQQATRLEGLVAQLLTAEPNQIPDIVRQLEEGPEVANQWLAPLLTGPTETADQRRARLHAQLAAVARDPSLVESLQEELLTCPVNYIAPLRHLLKPYAGRFKSKFTEVLQDETATKERRFAAALALADYLSESELEALTEPELTFVAQQLVSSNAEFQPTLRELLRPIERRLLPDLERIFGDIRATEAQRLSAANAFADYGASDIGRLTRLLVEATTEQYPVIYPLVADNLTSAVIDDLGQIAATLPPEDLGSVERIFFGQQRANAAVTMLRLGEREKVLSVFDWADDPEALTQFIFRCKPRGIDVETLLNMLEQLATSPTSHPRDARYALMLAIGEFEVSEIPASRRVALVEQLGDWYANDPSSGVHGAAGWLLRHLGEQEIVTRVDRTPVPYSPEREWFTLAVTVTPTSPRKLEEESTEGGAAPESESTTPPPDEAATAQDDATEKQDQSNGIWSAQDEAKTAPLSEPLPLPTKTFYYTFIVFPAGENTIGSVVDEPDRPSYETRQSVILSRPFALLDRELTFEELIAFSPQYGGFMPQFGAQPADAGFGTDWYDSVGFCRWLGQQMGLSEADQAYANPDLLDKENYPREPSLTANWTPLHWPLDLDRQGFRLPTSAEWEVACRAGARTAYGYGGDVDLLSRFGWSSENSGRKNYPTKLLRPSLRGLFDLHGNLNEWTHDYYGPWGVETQTDPTGPETGTLRLLRGGSWTYDAVASRAANRSTGTPAGREAFTGFRMAVSLSTQ